MLPTIIVSAVLFVAFAAAVRYIYKQRKAGKCVGCPGGCSGGCHCSACDDFPKENTK